MADFYIDTAGSSGTDGSSELLPKALLSQATLSANNNVYCKRGQTHPVGAYRFLASGMTLTAYGTGNRPMIQKTAGNDAWLYVQNASNITLSHFVHDCTGYLGNGIALTTGSGHAISNVTVSDVDVLGAYGSAGLIINGAGGGTIRNISVEDCTFYENRSHGTACYTDVSGVTYNRCVAYGNGTAVGTHNFSAYAASASPAPSGIRWQFCKTHDGVDFDGAEGTGIQSDDNTVGSVILGCYAYNNEGAGLSFNASSGHYANGNLCVGNGKPGLYVNNTTGSFALNNTMIGNCTRGTLSGEIQCINTSTTFTASNNLLSKASGSATHGIHLSLASATGSTGATNLIFGFGTVSVNITLSGTVEADPLLDAGYRPSASSPCVDAGTQIAGVVLKDYYGKEINGAVTIGAFQRYAARSAIASRSAIARSSITRSEAPTRAPYG